MKLGDIDRTFNSVFRQIGNINIELNKLRARIAGLQPSAQQTSLSDQGSSYILADRGLTGGGALPGTVSLAVEPGLGLGFDSLNALELTVAAPWSGLAFSDGKLKVDLDAVFSWANDHSWNGDALFIDVSERSLYINSGNYPDYRGALVVAPDVDSHVALVIQGVFGQSANLVEIRNDTGSMLIRVTNAGDIVSSNYVQGSSGWRLRHNGDAELAQAVVRGSIYSASGTLGGWTINADSITGGNAVLNSAGWLSLGSNNDVAFLSAADPDFRLWIGNQTPNNAPFRVTKSGGLTAANATISGTIYASGGYFSGALTVGSSSPNIVIDGVAKQIKTDTFSSGTRGFLLDGVTGNAEFNNVDLRGALKASVFEYSQVLVTGGTFVVAKGGGKLYADCTSVDSPTTFPVDVEDPDGMSHANAGTLWSIGDIIRLKDPLVGDLWATISSKTDMTTRWRLNVVKQSPGTGTNYTFSKGMTVINYGASGQGFLLMTADQTNAPFYSVRRHTGSPWTLQIELARMGNLNGGWGYTSNLYGIALGEYASNIANLTWDSTNGLRLRNFTTDVLRIDNAGSATLAGVLTIGPSGGFYQGTGTFSSPTTGLKIFNDGTYGRISNFNSSVEVLRIGNLNGNWGYSSLAYGFAIGEYASGKPNMTWDSVNGLRLRTYNTTVLRFDNSGNASIEGALSIGTGGGIYQGTGTFGNPTTGLKIWNDGGIGRLATFNNGVQQVFFDTDGKLYAGQGDVSLSADGLCLRVLGGSYSNNSIMWKDINVPNALLWISGYKNEQGVHGVNAEVTSAGLCRVDLNAYKVSGGTSIARLTVANHVTYPNLGGYNPSITLFSRSMFAGPSVIDVRADRTYLYNVLFTLRSDSFIERDIGNDTYYRGYIYVPLINSLTHSSLDGDALAQGTYTVGPIGSGATFQFDYPSIVRAVHVRIIAKWNNAISGRWAFVAPPGANYAQVAVHSVVAGMWSDNSGIVSTDTSGRFNLTVAGENATGIWLLITGFFL